VTTLAEVLDGGVGPAVHELEDLDDASVIAERVAARGWHFFHVDGADVTDKASFLQAVATACDFPEWFGHNWDALADSLADLSWAPAPGYVLLYDRHQAYASSPEWPMVVDIFEWTARRWAGEAVPFAVLLR
jgi:hypothetical protein